MIKQRKNAKGRKRVVIIPTNTKQLEAIRARLGKFPSLDFRQLLDQAQNSCNGMNLDDSFRATLSDTTDQQLAAVFKALDIDQADPHRFMKGFVLLSMALLDVGVVTYEPIAYKPTRWVKRHDEMLYAVVNLFKGQGLTTRKAIKRIANDPAFEGWFPYKKQTGKYDPRLTAEQQKEGALRERWYALDNTELEKPEAETTFLRASLGSDDGVSSYQLLLTKLDIEAAEKDRKKSS
jgi:hypothetical protein